MTIFGTISKMQVSSAVLAAAVLAGCVTVKAAEAPLAVTLPDLTSYALVQTDAGKTAPRLVSAAEAAAVLAAFDVVVIGEAHRNPGNHLAQMALFRELYARAPQLSLSMEQLERDVQPILDDYLADKLGEAPYLEKVRPWNNYASSYRPLVEFAKEHHLPVIAANTTDEVVRCVGERGPAFLDTLKAPQRAWAAAELHLGDGAYRAKFLGFAGGDQGHGGAEKGKDAPKGPSEQMLRGFAAQVTRDDTMAESIFLHLQKNPGRKVVHMTGYFHAADFLGTVERLQARAPNLKIAVVTPHEVDGSAPPVLTDANAKGGNFILLIRAFPEPYITDEEERTAIRKQMAQRAEKKCAL